MHFVNSLELLAKSITSDSKKDNDSFDIRLFPYLDDCATRFYRVRILMTGKVE